jgi:hypothetical protein
MNLPSPEGYRTWSRKTRLAALAAGIVFLIAPLVMKFAPWALFATPEMIALASWAFEIGTAVDLFGAGLLVLIVWSPVRVFLSQMKIDFTVLGSSRTDLFLYHAFVLERKIRTAVVWSVTVSISVGVLVLVLKKLILGA